MASILDGRGAVADEWLTIVETQQHELEQLRAQIAQSPERWSDNDARMAFAPSPAKSYTSNSSCESDDVPLDRYARVCDTLEATRQRLTLKDAKYRELRARTNQMNHEMDEYRLTLQDRNARVTALEMQIAKAGIAKEEAVERAAQAMEQSDELSSRLRDMTVEIERMRSEMLRQSEAVHEVHRRHSKAQQESMGQRETITRLEEELQKVQQEKETLLRLLQAERDERTQHICVSDTVTQLREQIQEQAQTLVLQTTQLERQQHMIVELHAATIALEDQLLKERVQIQLSIKQQLNANLSLQHLVDEYADEIRFLKVSLAESKERGQMQDEEISAYAAWKRSAQQRRSYHEAAVAETHETIENLERAVRCAETSRRKAVVEMSEAKRQLRQLQVAMVGVDNELEQMNKTFGIVQTREANVSRTLREYSRRNRVLLDAVRLMSAKVLQLSELLRRSEKRKHQVVVESHELKRGLVVERCQRQDLLKQCAELESCLQACQRAANDSVERAQGVERENAVLQHAVHQLCAYSREITQSQRALQRQLHQLEVEGRVEPEVYG